MSFRRIVNLFNHWSEQPTLTMMMQSYFGIDKPVNANDPMAMAEAMRAMGMSGKAEKVATAPAIDQERFAALREQLAKMKETEKLNG